MTELTKTHLEDGVLYLTINRPEKKNALTQAMYGAMAEAIARVETEKGVRALHVTGAGDCFTSGNDVGSFDSGNVGSGESGVVRFLNALVATDVPIVAAVNGPAVGVGVTMLLHMDFVYATPSATFRTPFVDLGVVPEAASSMLMPFQMGYRKAAGMLLMGDRLSADQALAAGIVGEIVAAPELLERSGETARRLAGKPARALRTAKRLMRLHPEPMADRLKLEFREFGSALESPEFKEAAAAFLEKRKPDFSKFD